MGSFKSNDRNKGSNGRNGDKGRKRRGSPCFESLEGRVLLSTTTWHPTDTNLADVTNGPMANEGETLIDIYQAFLKNGGNTSALATQFPYVDFYQNSVGIDVKATGSMSALEASLTNLGMTITATSTTDALIEGSVPVSQLPTVAELPGTLAAAPIYKPAYKQGPTPTSAVPYQGTADDEGLQSEQADTLRAATGLTGAGVTVGVLSDSVNQFTQPNGLTGLAASQATGDLGTVNVLQDLLPAYGAPGTDEGRAMLEGIHDIAPGASLAFASGGNGEVSMGQNIEALASAGASVIVDDLGYPDEPFFQDGVIQQGVDQVVTNNNVSYFSAAGNTGLDDGYLSTFKGTTAAASGSLPAGTYMNFGTASSPLTQLPITVNAPEDSSEDTITFQWDDPYTFQQPASATATPQSQLDFYVLDSNGNVVAEGNANALATGQPMQIVAVPNAGSYTVAIQLVSGPAPGNIEFIGTDENDTITVNTTAGNNAGVSYPSTYGHSAQANTIGVAAIPWWATTPFVGQTPLKNEPFSAPGPALTVRDVDGNLLSTPVTTDNPEVSGVDGTNTSFFPPVALQPIIDTTNPPFGDVASSTNLSQNLPSFFGTSQAAPNVAAVAALMKQRLPNLTEAQIRSGLETGTTPVNGATAGIWQDQGGYGLVNAVNAFAAVNTLTVSSTTPASGATVTQAPTQIVVTFDQPVNISSLVPADLAFLSVPSDLTGMYIGQPVGIDNATTPTEVAFPIRFTLQPNTVAAGAFTYVVHNPANGPAITAVSGKTLSAAYNSSFILNDTTAPVVTNTTINGRIITVTFSEPLNPATVTPYTVFLSLTDSKGDILQNLDIDPRFQQSYTVNANGTSTVTLNFSGLSQTQMPSGYYKITVRAGNLTANGYEVGVTDLAGNKLTGVFTGTFPSTNGVPGKPSARLADENFNQFLGYQTLTAPVITSLQLTSASDSGIQGDGNTNITDPSFIGQVYATFPGTISGLTVLAEFSGLHNGNLTLAPLNGYGYTGTYDVSTTTNANGSFTINAPYLPEGFEDVRLVVIGQPGNPNASALPGLSSSYEQAFRVDTTAPTVVAASLAAGGSALPLGGTSTPLNGLTNLSLDVEDPASPATGPLATPISVYYPALNPSTASNTSNYSLINTTTDTDESQFIASATFTATDSTYGVGTSPDRTSTSQGYYGRVDLTFAAGLPAGEYEFIAHTAETLNGTVYSGLTDAAGNPLNETSVPGEGSGGNKDFIVNFDIQPSPVYIESVSTNVNNAQGNTLLPDSYYEINPRAGDIVSAPPTTFYVDFSSPLNPSADYSNAIQLIRSANSGTGSTDGDFGNLGEDGLGSSGTGFTRVDPPGTTVFLAPNAQGIPNTRLVLQLPAGYVLPADFYRFYLPNSGATAIDDVYGNQLDGEFLGDPASSGVDANGNPAYEDLLPNGQYRAGMSGDGVAGGAFMAGFTVVPTGNLVYARPDYVENPLLPSTLSNGTISQPYEVLAPQATENSLNESTYNNGDPNGGLNSPVNFGTGFNSQYDRAGIGRFASSAFYAASQLADLGPVVIVALPGIPQTNPITGVVSQSTFVLQAPAGSNPTINNGSASVPADTVLVMAPGSTLKLENASLFVQNQGSALESLGGSNPDDRVTFTSYKNDAVAGDTNGDGNATTPAPGDWGGIVFRSFDQALAGRTDTFPVDGTLQAQGGTEAVSGADSVLSTIQFTTISYGGGAVPQTIGQTYAAVTLYNSSPQIVQDTITDNGGGGNAEAAISADLDSFRMDDNSTGPLVRRDTITDNGINGVWVRPNPDGVVETTNAVDYGDNPLSLGGSQNYIFNADVPYVFTSLMDIGTEYLYDSSSTTTQAVKNRLYIQPGMLLKFEQGAGVQVVTAGASLNVGDQTYIRGFDSDASIDPTTGLETSTWGPGSPGFAPNDTTDANVVFTSALDNNAYTYYKDPLTGLTTTIVAANDALDSGGANQPTPGNVTLAERWGSITIDPGAIASVNEAQFDYGGGQLNVPGGTTQRQVLYLLGSAGTTQLVTNPTTGEFTFVQTPGTGSHVYITNNTFNNNLDVPIAANPDAFLAANPETPLASGDPFIHGNIFSGNTYNAVGILAPSGLYSGSYDLSNNSVWTGGDFTYLLRGTIVPESGPTDLTEATGTGIDGGFTVGQAQPTPWITLTIQSTLPGTVLADGEVIGAPGIPVIVKLWNDGAAVPGNGTTGTPNSYTASAGAGFMFGWDNGEDPTNDPIIDQGNNDQLRILGIGGNQTTGQTRVPAIITSVYDDTVGTTVDGVTMDQVIPGSTQAPAAGDGGLIMFGSNQLPSYNALDIRQGSVIDNAKISYITRIELQGGNYLDNTAAPNLDQTGNELTISDSNLNDFSTAGVLAQNNLDGKTPIPAPGARLAVPGQPTLLFMVNDTVANMPTGVMVQGTYDPASPVPALAADPVEYVALNNTFYNNGTAVNLQGVNGASPGDVNFVAMDNIFSNSSTSAVTAAGNYAGSLMEYNLFYENAANNPGGIANFGEVDGNPEFRDAVDGDFRLLSNSAAINAGRSEMNLTGTTSGSSFATLFPLTTQVLSAIGGTFNGNTRAPDFLTNGPGVESTNVLTLPGYSERGYVDEWIPVLPTASDAIAGPASNAATFDYAPTTGQRDELGNLEVVDPNVPITGFGSSPFFDIGAFDYQSYNAPTVTGVTATVVSTSNPTAAPTTINLYKVGSYAGTNESIQTIQVTFSGLIDPNTITSDTVVLQGSGGDGIFGNDNDVSFNLSGKATFNNATDTMTINVGAAGLVLKSDEYRLTLVGTGSNVLTDPQGNALDGINTVGGSANGAQLALPSGNGFPGTNFYDTFIVNTVAPTIAAGSFKLSPGTSTYFPNAPLTNSTTPSFVGTINVAQPDIDPLAGQTVYLDYSPLGNGVFTDNIATAVTNGAGQFTLTVGQDGANTGLVTKGFTLPNSDYSVGPDGLLYTKDDTGYTQFRIRVVDQSGNATDQPTDPLSKFEANNAVTTGVIDTTKPTVTSISPPSGSSLNIVNGAAQFTVVIDKNINPNSIKAAGAITVTSAGPDGIFGTADDVPSTDFNVTINSINAVGGPGSPGGSTYGPAKVVFTVTSTTGSLPNTLYQVTIATSVTDLFGNGLAGNFVATYALDNASNSNVLFVGAPTYVTNANAAVGDVTNPYPTIQAAITAANPGDTIAVLPGVYTEEDTLKPFIHLESVAATSTDANLVRGNALATVIRAPAPAVTTGTTPAYATITATNLPYFAGLTTTVSGFTIASPLLGTATGQNYLGPIDPASTGVQITNSDVLVENDYIIDSENGVQVTTSGSAAATPQLVNDVVVGNINGITLNDTSSSLVAPTQIINDDIALNTYGIYANTGGQQISADIINNIFWENHDLTTARKGYAIYATASGFLSVQNNLFSDNGASDSNPAGSTLNVGGGFDPTKLSATPDALKNFVGSPDFISPTDPRPNAAGPGTFFNTANYGITVNSSAIDNANETYAPATDFLGNAPVKIAGRVSITGGGPADIGAFEYVPSSNSGGSGGSTPVTGLAVTSSSIQPVNGTTVSYPASAPPTSIVLTFSEAINASAVPVTAMTLTGSGLNPVGPARVISVTQVASNKLQFNLSSGFSQAGTVTVKIAAGLFKATSGDSNAAYTGTFTISSQASTSSVIKAASVSIPGVSSSSTIQAAAVSSVVVVPATATETPKTKTVHLPKGPLHKVASLLHRKVAVKKAKD